MKYIFLLTVFMFLISCASIKSKKTKNETERTFAALTESYDAEKLIYIGIKNYCVGGVQIDEPSKKDCRNCYSNSDIYIFWSENKKSYVKKYDNCSEFNSIEISNFKPKEYLKNNSSILKKEKIGRFEIAKGTFSTVSHSCFTNYIINDGQLKYEKEYDNYDLTGEQQNLNYQTNNDLKIILLDKKLDSIIMKLEQEDQFERDIKTCNEY